jgi:hypothetical protein
MTAKALTEFGSGTESRHLVTKSSTDEMRVWDGSHMAAGREHIHFHSPWL